LVLHQNNKFLQSNSSLRFILHQVYPCIPIMIIYDSEEELMTMNGGDINGSPYIYMHKLKNMFRYMVTLGEGKSPLFSQMT